MRGKAYRDRCQIQRHVYGNSTQMGYIGILMPQNLKKKNTGPQSTQWTPSPVQKQGNGVLRIPASIFNLLTRETSEASLWTGGINMI